MVRCFTGIGRPCDGRVLTAQTFLDHDPDAGLGTAFTAGSGFGFLLDQRREVRVFLEAAVRALESVIVRHSLSVAALSEGI